ncbi:GNAT family N-acetyltransferase [Lachnoclostridium sp. An14]|uniref:GNAT family N-acetyltransferase n=1 Tax=Lachnoclostridium sp. An14 TaxID=1965562 RepID=UPI000B381076|nr:GNAT family N-acetyltransferase [Lachnoclostridium sp. An14]OUQ15339.1 GNAT family N-acetyltransferase [Lachnoclostridium sp. An14]
MIRAMENTDASQAADLWLAANTEAHSFIPVSYWREHYEAVKEMLLQAEVYVWEEKGRVLGFVGLNGYHIEGIFVAGDARSRGIGKGLLDFVKERKRPLSLNVYRKNPRAIRFYEREGFVTVEEGLDEGTGEPDLFMKWE